MSCIVSDCDAFSAENALVYYVLDEEFQTVALLGTHRFLVILGWAYESQLFLWSSRKHRHRDTSFVSRPFFFSLKCDRTCPGWILL